MTECNKLITKCNTLSNKKGTLCNNIITLTQGTNMGITIDTDTGERFEGKFMKMFFSDISRLYGLNGTAKDVLFEMGRTIGLGNVNHLNMTPARKKAFAKKLGFSTYRTIDKALRELKLAGVVKILDPEEYPNQYTIDPQIMYSGNDYQWANILIEYSGGKRNIKTFPNQDALDNWLEQQRRKNETK